MNRLIPTLITPDGREHPVMPDHNGQVFQLKQLQAIVGGYIQYGATHDGRTLVMNEDGKRLGLPPNPTATKLYVYGDYAPIVGDVLVTPLEYLNGE